MLLQKIFIRNSFYCKYNTICTSTKCIFAAKTRGKNLTLSLAKIRQRGLFFVSIRHDWREETPQLGPGPASHPRQEENPTQQGLRRSGGVRGPKWSVREAIADTRRSYFSCTSLGSPQAAQRQPRTHQQIVAFPAVRSASRRIRDWGITLQGRPVTFPRRPTSAGRRGRAVSRRTSEHRPPHPGGKVEVNWRPAFDAGEGPASCG